MCRHLLTENKACHEYAHSCDSGNKSKESEDCETGRPGGGEPRDNMEHEAEVQGLLSTESGRNHRTT